MNELESLLLDEMHTVANKTMNVLDVALILKEIIEDKEDCEDYSKQYDITIRTLYRIKDAIDNGSQMDANYEVEQILASTTSDSGGEQ